LESLDGFECLHADILVYYRWSIDSGPVSDTTPEQFEISDHPSWAEVESVLTETFSEYRNHYSANSRLASSVTLSGYQEWAAGLYCSPLIHLRNLLRSRSMPFGHLRSVAVYIAR
jgi:hypothetical protein